jgi:hypothetical protein
MNWHSLKPGLEEVRFTLASSDEEKSERLQSDSDSRESESPNDFTQRSVIAYLERCLIFRLFFCRRLVLFFFHFQRKAERAFLYGFDL